MENIIHFENALQSLEKATSRTGKGYIDQVANRSGEIVIFPGVRREYFSDDEVGSDPDKSKRRA